jgi:hypothetical protein
VEHLSSSNSGFINYIQNNVVRGASSRLYDLLGVQSAVTFYPFWCLVWHQDESKATLEQGRAIVWWATPPTTRVDTSCGTKTLIVWWSGVMCTVLP